MACLGWRIFGHWFLRAAVKSNITNLENVSLFNVLEVVYEFLFSALGAPNMSFVQNK